MGAFSGLLGLRRRDRHERAGFLLYGAVVGAARAPRLYTALGVPDTLDGRFEMISLYGFLLIDRLRRDPPPGPALAQSVFDAMFSDMDTSLREMGVGDLSVGKRVRAMWEAFHGRSTAYQAAMEAPAGVTAGPAPGGDPDALAAALARNVWRGAEPPAGCPAALARLARAQHDHLASQALAALTAGDVDFLAQPA
jgi:cytochrome b pre-mRNA-processing protein 3